MWICTMETWVFYLCDVSQISYEKAERGRSFSAKFSGIFIFIIDSYYRDLSCCKSITKNFATQLDNDI